jgi:hypothetical protein
MADPTKKSSGPHIGAEAIWYALPGVALVGFFAWVLFQMGSQSSGGVLVRMLVGIAVVLIGGGVLFWLLSIVDRSKDD